MTLTRHASVGRLALVAVPARGHRASRWWARAPTPRLPAPHPPGIGSRRACSRRTTCPASWAATSTTRPSWTSTGWRSTSTAGMERRHVPGSHRSWVSCSTSGCCSRPRRLPSPTCMAAEPTLSEADDAGLGAAWPDDPLTPATRHWAGEDLDRRRARRDGRLAHPGGPGGRQRWPRPVFGPGLEMRRAIAERALARLETAFGPRGSPTGRPLSEAGGRSWTSIP